MFAPHSSAETYVRAYQEKFICLDEADLNVQGDFNQDTASIFSVQLVKCEGGVENGCKTEDEILKYFR